MSVWVILKKLLLLVVEEVLAESAEGVLNLAALLGEERGGLDLEDELALQMLLIVLILQISIDLVVCAREVHVWVLEQLQVVFGVATELELLIRVINGLDYLFQLLFPVHSFEHEQPVIVHTVDVRHLVPAHVVVHAFFEGFEELLDATQDIVDFSGLQIVGMRYFIPCHLEIAQLLLEL